MLFISSCGSSIEEDASKMAELQCEQIKITMGGAVEAIGGKTDLSEIQDHQKKIERFVQKMHDKYSDFEEKQKFAAMVQEELFEICL